MTTNDHRDLDLQALCRLGVRTQLAETEAVLARLYLSFPEEFAGPPPRLLFRGARTEPANGNGSAPVRKTRAKGNGPAPRRIYRRRNGKDPLWVKMAEILRTRKDRTATLRDLVGPTKAKTAAALATAVANHRETFERVKPGVYRLKG